ncbi:MAG: hypothetical protein HYY65_08065 [Candidatus Tectomicrobia bacterium]|uniref:Uncharacterized protein n=1 Tax=Tectimicrobiota bacterium TaxID=2528274 RepID=A0A932M0D6_UNCTE|nr:hypothetical protein [Candidatus Tectomicrobia bacterium]
MILKAIEQCLREIYQIELPLSVEDFLIDQHTLESVMERGNCRIAHRKAGGFLLISEGSDDLYLAVYLDGRIISNLTSNDPRNSLNSDNLADFCTATEEVSHFAYTAWNALQSKPVTPLELELQGEVDKFVTCYFFLNGQGDRNLLPSLKAQLFEEFSLDEQLAAEQRARYLTASQYAGRYCHHLEQSYVREGLPEAMIRDLRRFYRMGMEGKFLHIQRSLLQ